MTGNRDLVTATTPLPPRPPRRAGAVGRWSAVAYAVACYLVAQLSLLYLAGFLADVAVPRDVDAVPGRTDPADVARRAGVDAVLVLIFAVQHSVMARGRFKRALTRAVPAAVERSTYVLAAGLTLLGLMWWWQPLPGIWWRLTGAARALALAGYAGGWLIALAATFQVSHADLFGLRQVWAGVRRRRYASAGFTRAGLLRLVRHPLMLGLLVVLWAAPTMTTGHGVLAVALTGYVLVGTALEERDLVAAHGAAYREYRASTPALLPGVRLRRRTPPDAVLSRPSEGSPGRGAGRRRP